MQIAIAIVNLNGFGTASHLSDRANYRVETKIYHVSLSSYRCYVSPLGRKSLNGLTDIWSIVMHISLPKHY